MKEHFTVTPIGRVVSTRSYANDDDWDAETTWIELDSTVVAPTAAVGLDSFSHIEVIYLFDRVTEEMIETGSRRPRGNPDWPDVGILAQRGRMRPNRLGATICQLESLDGARISVRGLDAIDGTPVLDIKPVMSGFLPRTTVTQPDWADEIMREYW
jgi:tRNA (Thr-GGU) A37 N-methylase